jgi:hypothetical protein
LGLLLALLFQLLSPGLFRLLSCLLLRQLLRLLLALLFQLLSPGLFRLLSCLLLR